MTDRRGYLITAVGVLLLLAACSSRSPDYQQVAKVRVVVDKGGGSGDLAPLGVPATEGGISGVTQVELSVYRGGTLVLFDADGNEDPAGSGDVVLDPELGVGLNLMYGSYEFRVTAGDDDDNLLATGSLAHTVAGDVNLQVPLVSEIGSAELVGPVVVQAEQLFDVFLHVMPPGRSDLWVPVTDFVAVYSHEGMTAVGSSSQGIRFDASVSCEAFDLMVEIYRPGALDEIIAAADLSIPEQVICPVEPGTIGVDVVPPQLVLDSVPALTTLGFEVELTGSVNDDGSGVAGVQVYDGPILIGDAELDRSVSPHTWWMRWTPAAVRSFDLRFVALDDAGNQTTARLDTEVSTQAVFASIATGGSHACGLTALGAAYCWGFNVDGQLGTGDNFQKLVPTKVEGSWEFMQITTGDSHSCGLTAAGQVACWGLGEQGQLGDGSTNDSNVPVQVNSSEVFTQLVTGGWHNCARSASGDWYCWGLGLYGRMGTGDEETSPEPVLVPELADYDQLVAGHFHGCGLTSGGMAYCWGYGLNGQLGHGSYADSLLPVAVAGGLSFSSLSAGQNHTCGVTTAGQANCWGLGQYGRLGYGMDSSAAVPQQVTAPAGSPQFESVSAGTFHTCALTDEVAAYCWGYGFNGELGNGTVPSQNTPLPVAAPPDLAHITAGGFFTCGLSSGGSAYCWGAGYNGSLGNGLDVNQATPTAVVVATPDQED